MLYPFGTSHNLTKILFNLTLSGGGEPLKALFSPRQALFLSKIYRSPSSLSGAWSVSLAAAKYPLKQPFARGEFQNSPVDFFGRGDALKEIVPWQDNIHVFSP